MTERCKYAVKRIKELNISSKNTPTSIAAGSIYMISMIYNLGVTKDQIKKATKGVSKVTINKCFTTLYANRAKLLMSDDELNKILEK